MKKILFIYLMFIGLLVSANDSIKTDRNIYCKMPLKIDNTVNDWWHTIDFVDSVKNIKDTINRKQKICNLGNKKELYIINGKKVILFKP